MGETCKIKNIEMKSYEQGLDGHLRFEYEDNGVRVSLRCSDKGVHVVESPVEQVDSPKP